MEKHKLIFIVLLCTPGYNSLCDLTRQHKVWRKILLQADPIERLTACVLGANIKFNYSTWCKNDQNEMKLHSEYDYDCIRNSLSSYPLIRGLQLIWHGQLSKINNALNFLTSFWHHQLISVFFFFKLISLFEIISPQSIWPVGYI